MALGTCTVQTLIYMHLLTMTFLLNKAAVVTKCLLIYLFRNSEAICLVQLGLMADRQANQIRENVNFFTIHRSKNLTFHCIEQSTALLQQYECVHIGIFCISLF